MFTNPWLDPHVSYETIPERIGQWGVVLKPGILYLGATMEYTESHSAIPMINGRSSLARLGLVVHQTGGFGDLGFCGTWTLELSCIHPIRLYAGMQIAQICWFYPHGMPSYYNGKYVGQRSPTSSKFHLEVKDEDAS
jgi:dCTP deaminase